ncbi:MAG: hypothetical protein V9G08_02900 [Dermatophilaceae bacterium]
MNDPIRPRRPLFFGPEDLEANGGLVDPVRQIEAAHETAAVLVRSGRAGHDPQLTDRLVGLVDDLGIGTVAQLWSARPARSLPGALWRLYVLREWVHRDPAQASREYAAGVRFAGVQHAVAGAAEPPGPDQLIALVDAVLRGVFDGDLAVALERAASFCRVVSAGRADVADGEPSVLRAAALQDTATDLEAAARLWRDGGLA